MIVRCRMDVYELDDVRTPNASAPCHYVQPLEVYVRTDEKKKLREGRTGS